MWCAVWLELRFQVQAWQLSRVADTWEAQKNRERAADARRINSLTAELRQSQTDEETAMAVKALEKELVGLRQEHEEALVKSLAATLRQGGTQLDMTDVLDNSVPSISFEDCEQAAKVLQGSDFDAKRHKQWLKSLKDREMVPIEAFVERYTELVSAKDEVRSVLTQFRAFVNARIRSRAEQQQ